MKVGLDILKLLIGNSFGTFDSGDLDLLPNDLIILYKGIKILPYL